jgi:prepilin-type N-terminal cleavage/methylation domain-containing protein
MKQAFTIIELIFVIVIIGILSAVAIPRLSATRDDAKISQMISNARIAVGDIGNYIATSGTNELTSATIDAVTSINFSGSGCVNLDENSTVLAPTLLTLCDESIVPASSCIAIVVSGNGDVQVISASGPPNSMCQIVATDPAIVSLAGIVDDPSGKLYHFAGERIIR